MQSIRRLIVQCNAKHIKIFAAPLSSHRNDAQMYRFKALHQISMATAVFDGVSSRSGTLWTTQLSYATAAPENELVDPATFEKVCEETLDSLCDYLEGLIEKAPHLTSADVSYGSGVLTVKFGEPYGTYVINKQSPNRQIWLSSPTSGPKRYDYVASEGLWIYKHNGESLHQLLQNEMPAILKTPVDFTTCLHSYARS